VQDHSSSPFVQDHGLAPSRAKAFSIKLTPPPSEGLGSVHVAAPVSAAAAEELEEEEGEVDPSSLPVTFVPEVEDMEGAMEEVRHLLIIHM